MLHKCQTDYEVPIISYKPEVPLDGSALIYSRGETAYALFPDGTEVALTIGNESSIYDNWFNLSS